MDSLRSLSRQAQGAGHRTRRAAGATGVQIE